MEGEYELSNHGNTGLSSDIEHHIYESLTIHGLDYRKPSAAESSDVSNQGHSGQQPQKKHQQIKLSHVRESPMFGAIVLSCAVFWFCGMIFGGAAWILVVIGLRSAAVDDDKRTRRMMKASYALSIVGIIIGTAVIVGLAVYYGTNPRIAVIERNDGTHDIKHSLICSTNSSSESILDGQQLKLTCTVTHTGSLQSLSIQWTDHLGTAFNNTTFDVNPKSLTSVIVIVAYYPSVKPFTCTVKYADEISGFTSNQCQTGNMSVGIDEAGPRDCRDIKANGQNASGVYRVIAGSAAKRLPINVYCDMSSPSLSWLVFQRRQDGTENFERNWVNYTVGFGSLVGEFWLGNEALYLLTSNRKYKLRINLEDFDGQRRYAEYSSFSINSSADNYRLNVSGYSGDAGDSLSYHDGQQFSTKDADHDEFGGSCAQTYRGAWWYKYCHSSNLNGLYHCVPQTSSADGIAWNTFRGYYYSLKTVEMKITPLY